MSAEPSPSTLDSLNRFHRALVEGILRTRPAYLNEPFTVSEIYQNLVPYQTCRDRIGIKTDRDYEDVLLRLLAGEGGYLLPESEYTRSDMEEELRSPNPNTGLYREYAAVDVRLNPLLRPRDLPDPVARGKAADEVVPAPPAPSVSPEVLPISGAVAPGLPSDALSPGPLAEEQSLLEPVAPRARTKFVSPLAPGGHVATHCASCRQTLPQRDMLNYCPFCGADLHKAPCPTCGEEVEVRWRFCVACGAAGGDPT